MKNKLSVKVENPILTMKAPIQDVEKYRSINVVKVFNNPLLRMKAPIEVVEVPKITKLSDDVSKQRLEGILTELGKQCIKREFTYAETLAMIGKELINQALVSNYGNQSKAARQLNISRATLAKVIKS